MSDQRYDAAPTVGAGQPPRAGYVPRRANMVRDGVAVVLLVLALLLPWNLDFGLGAFGNNATLWAVVVVATLLAISAVVDAYVGKLRLANPDLDVRMLSRVRLIVCLPYFVTAIGFVGYHLAETVQDGGTGLVPPGVGPGLIVGLAGALLAAQPPITSITLEDNRFRRWYAAARFLGAVSIGLATLAVGWNLYWRLRYLFVADAEFGGQDIAVIVTTLLYGAVALTAVIIASRWLLEKSAAARLAVTALGGSAAVATTLVWILPVGRDVDAFHGIAQNTSTAAIGYEGYLFWAAAAAIVAPTTLYAVFQIQPPTLGAYRSAAQKCLTLIAFWAFAAATCRVADFVIAWSLDLPRALYDTVAMAVFNLVTGFIAWWLHRWLARGDATAPVIAAFSAALTAFTVANLAIGVALAPRYAEAPPNAIYGNNLAQQITSTFDVVVCLLSLTVLVAMLFTGPLAGFFARRRNARPATPPPPPPQPEPPTAMVPPPLPRIARRPQENTTVIPAPPTQQIAAPTEALRIQRREPSTQAITPPDDSPPTTAYRRPPG
ncbi:hypothetical protein A5757_20800 [Mycobacterium sp. 852013-51886_SCH5428379]|uniref:DUF7937 domain-containing protein n=1 Tax=Mycobacterium sp. 852013-51886_SCH5428379 TaxID=1834111 RepID=UPI0007FB7C4E|nr:hypothetical protein [Mycobacterium sp. 852013-51886_SCH5428379]OBB57083.1 hypothetical protein A5757_20800 [Mycobacterium sp. 852013-51886_SCH5428379]